MHVQTHVMSGWCVGNCVTLTPRERLFCMLAGSLSDLDGLSLAFGKELYWDYHHTLCHNLLFGLFLCCVLTMFSKHRFKGFIVYFALFHLHLVMDYVGSGPGWAVAYLWPFSTRIWEFRSAWEFYSWQNLTAAIALLIWTLQIAIRRGRTPLEVLMPALDKQLVEWLRAGWQRLIPRRLR